MPSNPCSNAPLLENLHPHTTSVVIKLWFLVIHIFFIIAIKGIQDVLNAVKAIEERLMQDNSTSLHVPATPFTVLKTPVQDRTSPSSSRCATATSSPSPLTSRSPLLSQSSSSLSQSLSQSPSLSRSALMSRSPLAPVDVNQSQCKMVRNVSVALFLTIICKKCLCCPLFDYNL